eukprot:699648-Rhodomonas_salina.1
MDERFNVTVEDLPNDEDVDPELRTKSKSLIRSLLFPAGWCHPEIAYSVCKVARFAAKPTEAIFNEALRILKFL